MFGFKTTKKLLTEINEAIPHDEVSMFFDGRVYCVGAIGILYRKPETTGHIEWVRFDQGVDRSFRKAVKKFHAIVTG